MSPRTSPLGAVLTCTAPLLHLADEDAQAMLRAAPHTETQPPRWALLHPHGVDDVALITVGCRSGDTDMTPMPTWGTAGPLVPNLGPTKPAWLGTGTQRPKWKGGQPISEFPVGDFKTMGQ